MAGKFLFENGVTAKDIITGFEGVIVGRADYMTGCNQYCLSPKVGKGNTPTPGQWFDETRLVIDKKKPIVTLPIVRTAAVRDGGPRHGDQAPSK